MLKSFIICPFTSASGNVIFVKYDFQTLNIFVRLSPNAEWVLCTNMGAHADYIEDMIQTMFKTPDIDRVVGLRERINALEHETRHTMDDVLKKSNLEQIKELNKRFDAIALP